MRHKRRGNSRYFIIFLGCMVFMGMLFFVMQYIFRSMEFFTIDKVEITGYQNLGKDFYEDLAKDTIGMNLYSIRKDEIAARYENIVRVRNVKVSRVLPKKLKIAIEERLAVLHVKTKDGVLLPVDRDLIVLDSEGAYLAEDTPIVSLDIPSADVQLGERLNNDRLARIYALHNEIARLNRKIAESVSEYYFEGREICMIEASSGCLIYLGDGQLEEKLHRLEFFGGNKGFLDNTVLDLRYKDQIVARTGD